MSAMWLDLNVVEMMTAEHDLTNFAELKFVIFTVL